MFSSPAGNDAASRGAGIQPENEESINDVLSAPSQKIELVLLVLLCTDAMKQNLLAAYVAPELEESGTQKATPGSEQRPSLGQRVSDGQRRQRQMELETANLQGLKRAASTHFEAWRARVLRRFCVLVGSPDQVKRARREYNQGHPTNSLAGRELYGGASDHEKILAVDNANKIFISWTGKRDMEKATTSLSEMTIAKRKIILNASLSLLLSLESYSAHSRVLMQHLTRNLNVKEELLTELENVMARGLVQAASQLESEEYKQKEIARNASSNKWKVGLATVAGAALIGVTGGLAAPFLVAGVGSVLGAVGLGAVSGLLGVLVGSPVMIAGLFGAYGAKMSGKMVEELSKDVNDFKFMPVRLRTPDEEAHLPPNHDFKGVDMDQQHLRVIIGVPGSMTSDLDIPYPAYVLTGPGTTTFALRWEVSTLIRLGVSLNTVLRTYIWETARFELLRRTVFASLAAGLWPLGLIKLGTIIDNPFNIARTRADKAGKILAATLIGKAQGERPVTLVGWGVGARVVYSCLMELARQNAFGLVENAALLGTPAPSRSQEWTRLRSMVSGRLINVYSEQDIILGLLYRANTGTLDVAGLQAVTQVSGVENVNVSDLVDSHTKYRLHTGQILKMIGFEDLSVKGLARELTERRRAKIAEKANEAPRKQRNPEKEAKAVEKTISKVIHEKVDDKARPTGSAHITEKQRQVNLIDLDDWDPPPAYTEIVNEEKRIELGTPVPAQPPTDLENLDLSEDIVCSTTDNRGTIVDVEDLASDHESEHSDLGEMDYLDPEPISDSELDLDEEVSFGSAGGGFELTWKGKHGR